MGIRMKVKLMPEGTVIKDCREIGREIRKW